MKTKYIITYAVASPYYICDKKRGQGISNSKLLTTFKQNWLCQGLRGLIFMLEPGRFHIDLHHKANILVQVDK